MNTRASSKNPESKKKIKVLLTAEEMAAKRKEYKERHKLKKQYARVSAMSLRT
jgi:hypothetical protein